MRGYFPLEAIFLGDQIRQRLHDDYGFSLVGGTNLSTSLCSAQTRGARRSAFQLTDTIVSDCDVSRHKRAPAGLVWK